MSDLENSPKFVELEDLDSLPKRQFKTAEIADAVMGTEASIDPSDIESLFPKNVKDFQSGFSPPCDENSVQCGSPAVAAKGASLEERSTEALQQVIRSSLDALYLSISISSSSLAGNYIFFTTSSGDKQPLC